MDEPDPDAKTIVIKYDYKTQAVHVTWDNQEYKTFEFLLGVMEMARLQVETIRNMAMSQKMQMAAMDQQRMAGILRGK